MNEREESEDDLMNGNEAGAWLKIPKSTLHKLCTDGELTAAKVGRHWRFHRNTLEKWLQEKSER